ncbi:MAG: type II secretion system GspH family protein [Clostridiales bacterium]|nr:type II secretion system GspH family protein [Clostridiales bacterium]
MVLLIKNENKGFTLLEVVLSIAALSMISIFLLQMFMSSSTLNRRAKDADIALGYVISEIERIKSRNGLPTPETAETAVWTFFEGGVKYEQYFDKDWNGVAENDSERQFILSAEIIEKNGGETQGLYEILVGARDLKASIEHKTLSSLRAEKYFPVSAKEVEP